MKVLIPFLPILFPLAFVVFWLAITGLIALMGWRRLLEFQTQTKPTGRVFPFSGATVGGTQYNGALTFIVAPEGLWMRPILPFRAFHPPLLIPWNAFGTPKERKIFFARLWEIPISTRAHQKVVLGLGSGALRNAIEAQLQRPMQSGAIETHNSPFN